MEWTRAQRYQKLDETTLPIIENLKTKVKACTYRQKFHVQPNTGLLNDPNGFSYFNGEYHLFYQWFPLGPVHGVKYWYHVSSKNLVEWKDCGVALTPNAQFNSHGVFSGSGLVHNEQLNLMYTGNVRDENWTRNSYHCLATMDKNGEITSNQAVIHGIPKGYTEHFRDPKLLKVNDVFYCLIGAENSENQGTIVYYRSADLTNWEFQGEIQTQFTDSGFMWECPDYFEVGDKAILILSPQGIAAQGDEFNNIFQSGYLVGQPIDFETGTFQHGKFTELDRGFEFYAPQTMTTPDGRHVLIAWMGLPGIETISAENGWAHCTTLPRELTLVGEKLMQKPLTELQLLRKEKIEFTTKLNQEVKSIPQVAGSAFEMITTFSAFSGTSLGIKLRKGATTETVFQYDLLQQKLILDRSHSGRLMGEEYGNTRACKFTAEVLKLQIFADESSLEIFVNDGEEVFTTRIFTDLDSTAIQFFAEGTAVLQTEFWPYD
ncbi:MAG: sucrose-6-phosphate hydrolase [Culicoidibacterales bacterium]